MNEEQRKRRKKFISFYLPISCFGICYIITWFNWIFEARIWTTNLALLLLCVGVLLNTKEVN